LGSYQQPQIRERNEHSAAHANVNHAPRSLSTQAAFLAFTTSLGAYTAG